jgi:hypothetical protein
MSDTTERRTALFDLPGSARPISLTFLRTSKCIKRRNSQRPINILSFEARCTTETDTGDCQYCDAQLASFHKSRVCETLLTLDKLSNIDNDHLLLWHSCRLVSRHGQVITIHPRLVECEAHGSRFVFILVHCLEIHPRASIRIREACIPEPAQLHVSHILPSDHVSLQPLHLRPLL